MKRTWLTVIMMLVVAVAIFPLELSVSLNVGINQGNSQFFEKSVLDLSYSGRTFRESRQNYMGLGFSIAAHVGILNRLTLVPGFEIRFGHQSFVYEETGQTPALETEKNTYFFKSYSGQLHVHYQLLRITPDWNLLVLGGINFNSVVAEEETEITDENYWSLRVGIGTTLLQLKRFAFHLFGFYDLPFSGDQWRYFGAFTGVIYRF